MCARLQSNTEEPIQKEDDHICFRNWAGSSSAMEADIIVEAFRKSEELYNVKFGTLIADGDSSVYKKILEARPYLDLTVRKIECKNHLLRNYCKKLRDLTINSKLGHITLRKRLANSILRLRRGVVKSIQYWKNQDGMSKFDKISKIRKDILNGPYHVFGNHERCETYFCENENVDSKIEEMKSCGMLEKVMSAANALADHSGSLFEFVHTNRVEHFNSIVAKFIGGKRVNFALRRSYSGRSFAAAVSHNTRRPLYKLHKAMFRSSPGKFTKRTELKRSTRKQKRTQRHSAKTLFPSSLPDPDYGQNAQKPDLSPTRFQAKREEFLQSLKKTREEIRKLECETRLQRDSDKWLEERRKILTASNFSKVCKRRSTTGCEKLVKYMLYSDFDTEALQFGRENEMRAIKDTERKKGISIQRCGLFIDEDLPFLGATPDGLIGEDGVLEVKCPASAKELTPEEAILKGKVRFWSVNKEKDEIIGVNKNHDFYFQIQGQLHITQRKFCLFVLWTPRGLLDEYIERDDKFWKEMMQPKLTAFYMDCLLPELIDSRYRRCMPIRNPMYIIEAQEKAAQKKKKSLDCSSGNVGKKARLVNVNE